MAFTRIMGKQQMKSNLIGRRWSKEQNCYTLVVDYFKEKDIYLPDIPFVLYQPEFFLSTAQEYGFIQVELKDIQPEDVIITNYLVHLLIYLGDNQILHHPIKHLSRKELLTGEIMDNIKYIVRWSGYE